MCVQSVATHRVDLYGQLTFDNPACINAGEVRPEVRTQKFNALEKMFAHL